MEELKLNAMLIAQDKTLQVVMETLVDFLQKESSPNLKNQKMRIDDSVITKSITNTNDEADFGYNNLFINPSETDKKVGATL